MIFTCLLVARAEDGTDVLFVPIKYGEELNLHHFREGTVFVVKDLLPVFPLIFGDDPESIPDLEVLDEHQAELVMPTGKFTQIVCVVAVDQGVVNRLKAAGYTWNLYDLWETEFPPNVLTWSALMAFFASCKAAVDEDDKTEDSGTALDEPTN
jgi:hypothetical protein